jgi:hypothetical protein
VTSPAAVACAIFTSDGKLLTANVVGRDLQFEIETQSKVITTLHGLVDQAENNGRLKVMGTWQSCTVSAAATHRLAAVGIPIETSAKGENKSGVLVTTVNLETNKWGPSHLIVSNNKGGMSPKLIGFLDESENLLVATEFLSLSGPAKFEFEKIDASTGDVLSEKTVDVDQFAPVLGFFFDARNGGVWLESGRKKSKRHALQSFSLSDIEKPGPSVDLTKLHQEHWLPDWGPVNAMAFPGSGTIVFADTGASLGFEPNHLWVVDEHKGSVLVVDLPKDTGEVLLNGLGLNWFEDVGSPAVLSPDGRFLAVPITLTKTGPPYIVDNYISVGVRFVIVDLIRFRILSSIWLKDVREPISFALNHHEGKVTLLVRERDVWKHLEFDSE